MVYLLGDRGVFYSSSMFASSNGLSSEPSRLIAKIGLGLSSISLSLSFMLAKFEVNSLCFLLLGVAEA